MSTDIDWRSELDRAITHGGDRPVAAYITSGHRAVRRRRAVTSIAGLAAAALVSGVGWAAMPGQGPADNGSQVANQGSSDAEVPYTLRSEGFGKDMPPVGAVPPDGLQVRRGTVVHEITRDLFPGNDILTVALDVSYDGERWWVIQEWSDSPKSLLTAHERVDRAGGSFDEWVEETLVMGGFGQDGAAGSEPTDSEEPVEGADPTKGWTLELPPVRYVPGVGLQVRPGAEVHERRDDLDLGDSREAAAFDVSYADERWWVGLDWREGSDTSGFIFRHPGEVDGTFADFVAAYEAGEEMPVAEPIGPDFELAGLADFRGGELKLRDGATLVRRVDNPHGFRSPGTSIGLAVEHYGTTTWILASDRGGSRAEEAAESGWLTFDQWLAEGVAMDLFEPGRVELVGFERDGTLAPRAPGVEILEQRGDIDALLPGPDGPSPLSVAMIRWEGETYFVVRRAGLELDPDEIAEGEASGIPNYAEVTAFGSQGVYAAAKADGAKNLAEFLDFYGADGDR